MIIPREARAEGPSVARLINLSGRRPAEGRARELSRANSSRTYIYIYVCMYVCLYISVKVSVQHNLVPRVGKKRDPGNEVVCNSAQTKYE